MERGGSKPHSFYIGGTDAAPWRVAKGRQSQHRLTINKKERLDD